MRRRDLLAAVGHKEVLDHSRVVAPKESEECPQRNFSDEWRTRERSQAVWASTVAGLDRRLRSDWSA